MTSSNSISRAFGGQGKGGEVVVKPAPAEKKKTTPKQAAARKPTHPAKSGPSSTQNSTQPNSDNTEPELWEAIRNSSDVQDFKDYVQSFPNGAHVVIARTKIRQLEAASKTNSAGSLSNLPHSRANRTGIEFVLVPPGRFMMGSTISIAEEKPIHEVTINYSFYMSRYEVTQAQWQAVMGNNPSYFKECGAHCPVEQVSWVDAKQFLQRLNQTNDGFEYRLPTEAEWEYAARAGNTNDYVAGDLKDLAWFVENSGASPHLVGQKLPNAWGLADMHGNVWEWCEDWYHDNYYAAPTDGGAWLSGGEQKARVLRGGSWGDIPSLLRPGARNRNDPEVRYYYIGLRVIAVGRAA